MALLSLSFSRPLFNDRIPSQDKMADAFGQQAEKEEEISAEVLSKALHDKRVVMVATATSLDEIESTFRGYFTHQVVRRQWKKQIYTYISINPSRSN